MQPDAIWRCASSGIRWDLVCARSGMPSSRQCAAISRRFFSITSRSQMTAGVSRCSIRVGSMDGTIATSTAAPLRYDTEGFWDEVFLPDGSPRPHYAAIAERLATLSPEDVARRQRAADDSFQSRGITFAVNQGAAAAEGVEKIMPFDLVPRVLTADEWRTIERGLEQRVRALNLFLHDVYHDQRILADRVIPAELVLGARGYRRELHGLTVPRRVYTHVTGSDLVRDSSGAFFVLEDNLRTPSGVSYVVENRRTLKRVWPQLFHDYDVRPVEGYAQDLLDVLRAIAPDGVDEPTVVVLTPGVYNSAYFEHVFLARSEERRVGKEGISRSASKQCKNNNHRHAPS